MKSFFNALRLFAADLRLAMCKLNEIQFNAPWNRQQSRCN